MKTIILISGIALTLSLGMNPVYATSDPELPGSAADGPESMTADAAAPAEKSEYNFSDGMHIPVDGSSLESFDESLATIKTKTTASEYRALKGAIDYLMLYDLSARRDRAKLAQRLDGMNGMEIVDTVQKSKSRKR